MSIETEATGPGDATVAGPTQAAARLTPRRRGRWLAFVGPPFLVFLAVVGLWYGVSYLLLDVDRRFLLPPPHAVFQVALLDPYNLAELLDGLWLSTRVAFLGFAVAIVVGMALAVAMSQARWIERSLYRYLRRLHLFQAAGRCQPAVPVSPKPNRLAPASRFTGDCPAEAGAHTPIHGRFSGLRATPGDHTQRRIA
jgi:hypothetical protein